MSATNHGMKHILKSSPKQSKIRLNLVTLVLIAGVNFHPYSSIVLRVGIDAFNIDINHYHLKKTTQLAIENVMKL